MNASQKPITDMLMNIPWIKAINNSWWWFSKNVDMLSSHQSDDIKQSLKYDDVKHTFCGSEFTCIPYVWVGDVIKPNWIKDKYLGIINL